MATTMTMAPLTDAVSDSVGVNSKLSEFKGSATPATITDDFEKPIHARTTIHHYDHEWKDNPDQVEQLISKELLEMSVTNRNGFEDEIHGVRCIAPEETPDLLKTSLQGMMHELDNVIPLDKKGAYLRAKKFPQSYINQDDFRLMFLRCELFDVPKAAIRMVVFLDMLVDLFGEYALERPIRLGDFSKKELVEFRKGRFQLSPDRDRGGAGSGRRIIFVFPDKSWQNVPPKIRHKIALYQTFVAGYNDVDAQRKGMTYLVWLDKNAEPSWKPAMETKVHQIPVTRISALHICSPDTPFYRMRRALISMASGNYRTRMRIHVGKTKDYLVQLCVETKNACCMFAISLTVFDSVPHLCNALCVCLAFISPHFSPTSMNINDYCTKGDSMEMRYTLQGFGIPSDKIPITYSGSIKTTNLKKWMRLRHFQEDERLNRKINANGSNNMNDKSSCANIEAIDSPYLTDIIFRKGKSMMMHPGNATLRRVIKARIEGGAFDNEKNKTRKFITEIIDEIKQQVNNTGTLNDGQQINNPPIRLLDWDDQNGNCWREISDEDAIYNKIRHIVKEMQNIVSEERSGQPKTKRMIEQFGGTSIFQHRDSGKFPECTPSSCLSLLRNDAKKRKINQVSDDEGDMQCFGMKFTAVSL
jgi:hypothetical protein